MLGVGYTNPQISAGGTVVAGGSSGQQRGKAARTGHSALGKECSLFFVQGECAVGFRVTALRCIHSHPVSTPRVETSTQLGRGDGRGMKANRSSDGFSCSV